MRLFVSACFGILVLTQPGSAQNKQIQELQRDIGMLGNDVRDIQKTLTEKLAAMQEQLRQAADSATRADKSVAVLQSTLDKNLTDQQKAITAPVANLSAKIDELTTAFQHVGESVAAMNDRVNKMQTQITDIQRAITTLQAPPPAPAPADPGTAQVPAGPLFDQANRDRMSGKYTLALEEYTNYVKWYGTTDLACEAQYYIGDIFSSQGNFDTAADAFDTVLEKYSSTSCNKYPDARFMKGKSLAAAGNKTAANVEFRELLKQYPTGEWATKAKTEITALGVRSAPARGVASKKGTAKK